MTAAPDDPRWDSPLLSWWPEGHPDRLPRKRHDGTEERWGYPRAWDRCPSCIGRPGELLDGSGPCPFCHGTKAIKHLVRELAGHRCVRCGHPYRVGQESFWDEPVWRAPDTQWEALRLFDAEPTDEPRVKRERPVHWSPCDERCTHRGPCRYRLVPDSPQWDPLPDHFLNGGTVGRLTTLAGWEVQAAYRILTVHHLSGDKGDCRWGNLVALCQRCHLAIQGKVDMERPWMLEHSDWFKPYAAWHYAWKYEGVSPSRLEVEARMGELLAHERRDG